MKQYRYCNSEDCDAREIYDDYVAYHLSKVDERTTTTESDNDRLFQAYTSAIAVIHHYMNTYPTDGKARRWLDEYVASYYGQEE